MNLQNFMDDTLKNGGASYNLITGEYNPNIGYMISLPNKEQKFSANLTYNSLQYNIAEFIKENATILLGGVISNDKFIGSWVENETNTIYLDISIKVENFNEALKLAIEFNQLTIFDNQTKKTVYI